MWKSTALLGLLVLSLAHAQDMSDVNVGDNKVGTFVTDTTKVGLLPAIILISETGMINDFVLDQASAMVGAVGARAMVVDMTKLSGSSSTDFNSYSVAEMLTGVTAAYEATKTCAACVGTVDPTKIAIVGYGLGANAVLAAAAGGVAFQAGIAYTPMTAAAKLPSFSGELGPKLLIMPGYDEVAAVAVLEGAMAKTIMYEMFMQWGTKVHFNVVGNANYVADQAGRALAQSASYLTAVFDGSFSTTGTIKVAAPLTPESVTYKDGETDISGYVLKPTGVSRAPAVVVVPAWKGFDQYAIDRMQYLAAQGYVSMSANIYNLELGSAIEPMDQRMGNVSAWREAGNAEKGQAFANRIDAARDYIASQDYVSSVSVIGFCFGGTGVYNTYRFGPMEENEFAVQASFHGNMMKTRDFADGSQVYFKGYLAMYVGTEDAGESGDVMVAHLKDLSDNEGKWEMTRYSGAVHGFTEWGSGGYQAWAEGRSFQSFNALMTAKGGAGASSASSVTASTLVALLAAAFALFMARH